MSDWYLKKKDDRVYGPVRFKRLCLWAAEGRLDPRDRLSADRESWRPAPDVPALRMKWRVELPTGRMFGPIHILAACRLLFDGIVEPGATLESLTNENGAGEPVRDLWRLISEREGDARGVRESVSDGVGTVTDLKRESMRLRAKEDYLLRKVRGLTESVRQHERERRELKKTCMLGAAREEYFRKTSHASGEAVAEVRTGRAGAPRCGRRKET